ncbi:hypothetical protein SDC9_158407 [bioreactor metagenome]|uniref:Uncharacterized protein n=1 Tax=bioreactor metagenome TaxID=1076179 RepID=A0A645FBW2_9ZZZZ
MDISNAVSSVQYTKDGITYKRTYFLSNPDNVLVAKFTNDSANGKDYIITFESPLHTMTSADQNYYVIDGECPVRIDVDNHDYTPENFYQYDKHEKGICFRGIVKVFDDSADIYYLDDKIVINNSKSLVLYFTAETSFNGYDRHPSLDGKPYKDKCFEAIDNAASKGYEHLLDAHIKDYKKYYDRVSIDLCGKEVSAVETDVRLRNFQTDQSDLNLYALLFNYGRYLTISASRENTQPMNLQGIWNDKAVPPWNSNYTVNINTQMNYWPTLICDLAELNQPLIDFVRDI